VNRTNCNRNNNQQGKPLFKKTKNKMFDSKESKSTKTKIHMIEQKDIPQNEKADGSLI